jgi:hypothetical protein
MAAGGRLGVMDSARIYQAKVVELRWIDNELERVDRTRDRLMHRRTDLLAELALLSPPDNAAARPELSGRTGHAELSGRTVARLLLAAGAVLVVIAAAAFTAANWGSIGPLSRSSILLAVTVVVLTAPVFLVKRGLAATAESVAAVGLALTLADGELIARLLPGHPADGPFIVAAATAALAGLWAVYGAAARVRGPRLAAIGLAQLPGLFLIAGRFPSAGPVALGLVVTAGVDLALAATASRRERRPEELSSFAAAILTWLAGVALAGIAILDDHLVTLPSATLVVAALIGIVAWPRVPLARSATALVACGSGALLAVGLAWPVAAAAPEGSRVVAFAAGAAVVAVGAMLLRRQKPELARLDFVAAGAGATLLVSGLVAVPDWGPATPVVLGLLSLVCWLSPVRWRVAALGVGAVASALAVASLPAALAVAGWERLGLLTAGAAVLALVAGQADTGRAGTGRAGTGRAGTGRAGTGRAGSAWASGSAALALCAVWWSVPRLAMTVAELAAVTLIFGFAAARARNTTSERIMTAGAGLAAFGLVVSVVLAAGQADWRGYIAMLCFAAVALAAAARLDSRAGLGSYLTGLALECLGWQIAVIAVLPCLWQADRAALALAITGLLALGSALRPDRRRALWPGLVLLEAAWCVLLTWLGAGQVEFYTIPAALIVIGLGWQVSRWRPEFSSWVTYSAGIALALVPSLVVGWQAYGWIRPALLGIAAGAVVLTGAWLRLQAPLLLGIAVAVLDAGHQLAPEIRRLTESLPGWLPIAVTGAVLLWAGATYEARLRNLMRLRRTLAGLR